MVDIGTVDIARYSKSLLHRGFFHVDSWVAPRFGKRGDFTKKMGRLPGLLNQVFLTQPILGLKARHGSVSKPCTPVVHIKIAGLKWMFIPLKIWYFHRY